MRFFLGSFFLFINLLCAAQTIDDNSTGSAAISSWFGDNCGIDTSFSNEFKRAFNTSETVLKYADTGGDYANIRFDVPVNFDLSEKHIFTLKLYIPSNGLSGKEANQISLKLQDATDAAPWRTQSEIIKTVTLDEWQTVHFDFENDTYANLDSHSINPILRKDFNRIVLQINGENNKSAVLAYIDDFLYGGVLVSGSVFDTLVWSDEFNENGAIASEKWFQQTRPIIDGQIWANDEIQHYTARQANSYVSDGSLKILAKKERYTDDNKVTKEYTSARLNSKFAFTYGKVDIRAKMPFGVGTFPALWLLGQNITEIGGYWHTDFGTTAWPDCGEIDLIEHWGDNQDFVQSAMHNRSSFGGTVNKGGRGIRNASSEFHMYSLEWSADKMIFSVDGIVHYTYNPENKDIENWPYDAPQYLLLNLAILPNITPEFTESAMEIDFVRVYQKATLPVLKVGLN
jgi:beta-glucanase (GH16 family)